MQMSNKISMARAVCVANVPVAAVTAGRCALLIRTDGILAGKMSGGKKEHANFSFRINRASHQYSFISNSFSFSGQNHKVNFKFFEKKSLIWYETFFRFTCGGNEAKEPLIYCYAGKK